MAVKIYDNESKAFKDAETPLVHDGNLRAWKESTGLVWNDESQCWEERWRPRVYLYNRGNECVDLTGGWEPYSVNGRLAICEKLDGSLYVHTDDSSTELLKNWESGFRTVNAIGFDGYSKLCIEAMSTTSADEEPLSFPVISVDDTAIVGGGGLKYESTHQKQSFEIDIAGRGGNHKIKMHINAGWDYFNQIGRSGHLFRAWLEK